MTKTHGMSRTPENNAWRELRHRCENPNMHNYHRYGGRGIKVCKRWSKFENFYADMGPRPSAKHSIDRIDNDGDYTPDNCRWATQLEQAKNRGNNRYIELKGEVKHLWEWCRQYGVSPSTVRTRMIAGLTFEQSLTHKRYTRIKL